MNSDIAKPLIRTLIVDDEPLARASIRVLLLRDPDIEIIGECGNGQDAEVAILEHSPDLVFLDVEMPGKNGFEVIAALSPEQVPRIIFVTAYDQYAVDAFAINAIDYLLKPFDDDRFADSLARAKGDIVSGESENLDTERLLRLLKAKRRGDTVQRIAIREAGRIYFVSLQDVIWIGGAGNHAELHTPEEVHLHRESLASLEKRLDPRVFLRIHRSVIVRIEHVRELRPKARGDYEVTLKDDTTLTLSRRYHDQLSRLLEG